MPGCSNDISLPFSSREGTQNTSIERCLPIKIKTAAFGNALEPDKRTASSQPIDQEMALRVMDDSRFDAQVALQICDFLETITTDEGGVPFVLPTVRAGPRAEWWNTELDEPPASINPTASIAGLLHKHRVHHPWLDRATDYCWKHVEHLQTISGHDFLCIQLFLEHVSDRERAERAFERVSSQLIEGGHIAYDPSASGYVFMPLTYASTPQSMSRQLFDGETVERNLAALAGKQQADGGWPIAWPAVSPACELEYRGIVTLNALKTLKAYDYL